MSGFLASCLTALLFLTAADEQPIGKGMSDENKERLVIDDMQDISDWSNGSPVETTLSRSDRHKLGRYSLKFASVVDHTKGEKNYPIGWPRVGKELVKTKLSDWSAYDFFECWMYVDTSRAALPSKAIGVGFYHSGSKRSTSFPLREVAKDQWVRISIPINKIQLPADVVRVQFNIAESDYQHGDRVDFHINDVVLTRFAEPAVKEFQLEREVVFGDERQVTAGFALVGHKGLEQSQVELAIGRQGAEPAAKASTPAARSGEVTLPLAKPLAPGAYWARLNVRDPAGRLLDRKQAEFRVTRSPF